MPTKSYKILSKLITPIQKSRNDCIIVISGFRGVGKSTLMMRIAQATYGAYNFNTHHIYKRSELINAMENFKEFEHIEVDEAINSVFKREFQNSQQNNILKLLNMYRDKYYTIFFLIPNFYDLDIGIRNSQIVKLWIHCNKRGQAIVFKPVDNPFSKDVWNMEYNFALWKANRIFQSPNYFFNITWPDIEEVVYNEYKEVKSIKRREAYEDKANKKLTIKELVTLIRLRNPRATGTAIGKALGVEGSSIYTIINNPDFKDDMEVEADSSKYNNTLEK